MAQPSQVFPPWLTPSESVITNSAGAPVSTESTILYLPLTYFGPSIPLGSLWTFGGSTSPASTSSVPLTTTAIPSFTTTTSIATPTPFPSTSASFLTSNTATPISSTTTPTTGIPSTTSSLSSTSVTSSSSTPSSSSSTSSSSTPSSASSAHLSALTKGQLVGVIIASILGLIFVFVFILFLYLWCKGRRNRRQFTTLVPLDEDRDYDVLSPSDVEGYRVAGDPYSSPEGYRAPGEGSPRHSGDEASSFLRGPSLPETSAAGAAAATTMSQLPTEMVVTRAIPRVPPPTTNSDSSGSRSSNSHASGFGVLLDRPTPGIGFLPSMPEHPHGPNRSILPTDEMRRLDQENVLPDDPDVYEDGEYTGAYAYAADPSIAPPRILDPDSSPLHPGFMSETERHPLSSVVGSQPPELPELPEFGGDLRPRASSGLLGALGLGGLANLGRRSWFRNHETSRYSPDFTIEPFMEKDVEMGRAMLSPGSRRGVGSGPDGARPQSSSSARSGTSGGTVYHDAYSSTPGTPLLPPLPRAVTPATAPGEPSVTLPLLSTGSPSGPPIYDEDTVESPGLRDNLNLHLNFSPSSDILDMPAPVALHNFASVSSLKETTTGSSLGLKMPSFPPGLDTIRPIGWSDVATEVTASSSPALSTFGGGFSNSLSSSNGVTIDVLEDAPPTAEFGWRSIAAAGFGDAGRRGTFGLFIGQTGFMSEQGSLHSMRSHLNPSVRSTGSAPASRRDGSSSIDSASSRPSAHSLARTGSISSDGRRRNHRNSPTLSAFGGHPHPHHHSQIRPSPLSNSSHHQPPLDDLHVSSTIISSPPPCAQVNHHDKGGTIRALGSGGSSTMSATTVATVMDASFDTVRGIEMVRSKSTSPLSAASFAPWAAGLDNDWTPAA